MHPDFCHFGGPHSRKRLLAKIRSNLFWIKKTKHQSNLRCEPRCFKLGGRMQQVQNFSGTLFVAPEHQSEHQSLGGCFNQFVQITKKLGKSPYMN